MVTVRRYQYHDLSGKEVGADIDISERDRVLKRCWSWLLKRCWNGSAGNQHNVVISRHFSMTYCFYVVMGGFTVDLSFMHDKLKIVTLSPATLLALGSRGHFFDIESGTIKDKSKADLLAKGLVICQVSWLVIQSIARARAHLSLTILESHTMVHVVCALSMYCFWFKKPKDISDPTRFDSSSCQIVLAELLMRNKKSSVDQFEAKKINASCFPHTVLPPINELSYLRLRRSLPLIQDDEFINELPSDSDIQPLGSVDATKYSTILTTGQFLPCGLGPGNSGGEHPVRICLTDKDIVRWNLAAQSIRNSGRIKIRDDQEYKSMGIESQEYDYFIPRQINFSTHFRFRPDQDWDDKRNIFLIMVLCILAGTYGGVHYTTRNFIFPTDHERILWISSCYVMLLGAVLPIVFCLLDSIPMVRGLFNLIFSHESVSLVSLLLAGIPYVAARIYIVVEAFLSLRHVPIGVYIIPSCINYLPHL